VSHAEYEATMARRRRRRGTIYFVQPADLPLVKIGYTAGDLNSRVSSIQCHNHTPLTVVHSERGSRVQEQNYHIRFTKCHERGEWFRVEGKLKDFLEKKTAKGWGE